MGDLLTGVVERWAAENGWGEVRFDDGSTMRFDITASSFQPAVGKPVRAVVGIGLAGTPKIMRLLPVPSLDDPSTLQQVVDVEGALAAAEALLASDPGGAGGNPSLELRAKVAAIDARLESVRDSTLDIGQLRKRIHAFYARYPAGMLQPGEAFADAVRADLLALPPAARAPFDALLLHAATASGAKPSARWLQAARPLVRAAGGDRTLEDTLVRWLGSLGRSSILPELTADSLRGLVWIASLVPTPRMASTLGDLGSVCFKKIPNHGALSAKVGNACLWALGAISATGIHGVAQLGRLKMRVRYTQALRLVDKALADAAERAGVTSEELLELGVPTCGLDADGVSEEEIGSAVVRLVADPQGAVTVTWTVRADHAGEAGKAGSKPQASIPAAVKGDPSCADDLKALKARIKDIETLVPAQAARLERMMDAPRDIPLGALEERYLSHGLVGRVARGLVWSLHARSEEGSSAGKTSGKEAGARHEVGSGFFVDGHLVDVEGRRVDLATVTHARLWHPLGRPLPEVRAWQRFIGERGLTQPFKQAHREIYVLTPAEEATGTYSNRFAAHILKQHQLAALLRERGWSYGLQGAGDADDTARKRIPSVDLIAELVLDEAGGEEGSDVSDAHIFLHVATDQLRFRNREGEAVPLRDVPALVLSETMRDVDLFVSVTSVGNDPTWADRGPPDRRAYWQRYAFGELGPTAETRKAVLEGLIGKLKIKERLHIEGRFLCVRGDLRSYRIHLGSTNILMDPNQQYLCIVPVARARVPSGVALPFEGDAALSIILSKALMLAADAKIDDPSILAQIRSH